MGGRRSGRPARGGAGRPLAPARGLCAVACGLLAAGCGIGALVPQSGMPVEQQANLAVQRGVLFPLTLGGSEIALALIGDEVDRREAALRAPGGLAVPADRAGAEAAYQEQVRPGLEMRDPFTRYVLAARLWLAHGVDAGRLTPEDAREALTRLRHEVWDLRARRENFAPAAVHLRRTLWGAAPGLTLEGLRREGELVRRYRLDCPTERTWGTVRTLC